MDAGANANANVNGALCPDAMKSATWDYKAKQRDGHESSGLEACHPDLCTSLDDILRTHLQSKNTYWLGNWSLEMVKCLLHGQ